MANYSWTFDAPTGVFKNHALSSDMYENALQNSVFMPYVDIKEEFGKGKGESLTFPRFTHITEPSSAELVELSPIPEVEFSISTSSFVVKEYGVAVPYTCKLEMLSKYNIEDLVQRTLMEQKRLVLDTLAANAFQLASVKYVPTAAGTASITTNGTPSGTAVATLDFFHVEDISQYMYDTLNVPYLDGETYTAIFRAKTLTSLRRDSDFVAWNQYTNPKAKAKGECGIIERIKFVETNHAAALGYVGSNSFGEGVVFGKDAVGMVEAETPHLRAALPSGHGRFKSIAWYGLFGFNIIWDSGSVGEAKIVHVTSA